MGETGIWYFVLGCHLLLDAAVRWLCEWTIESFLRDCCPVSSHKPADEAKSSHTLWNNGAARVIQRREKSGCVRLRSAERATSVRTMRGSFQHEHHAGWVRRELESRLVIESLISQSASQSAWPWWMLVSLTHSAKAHVHTSTSSSALEQMLRCLMNVLFHLYVITSCYFSVITSYDAFFFLIYIALKCHIFSLEYGHFIEFL